MHAKNRIRPSGFTLVELLVTIAIIALLMVLVTPGVSRARQNALAAKCVGNIRSTGQILFLMATETGGRITSQRAGGGTEHMWTRQLRERGYLDDTKQIRCPRTRVLTPWHWRAYGMIMVSNYPDSASRYDTFQAASGQNVAGFVVRMDRSGNPAMHPLLADSFHAGTGGMTWRIADLEGGGGEGVCLMHHDQSHVLFLDGRVEPINAPQFRELGFSSGFRFETGESVDF